ncbi:MAG: zinc ribbon domain-containing protein [Actinobacteria bacterium]|nr:MAG: zinc ribbon domain-containing protein [Actinomycetota bacterium]
MGDLGVFVSGVVIIGLAILAFDIWMVVDAVQRPPEQYPAPEQKTWWIVGLIVGLVTALPAIAVAIAYYIIVRRPAGAVRYVPHMPPPAAPGAPGGAPSAPPPPYTAPPPPANCRNCGAKLIAGSRFCHSCGTPVG